MLSHAGLPGFSSPQGGVIVDGMNPGDLREVLEIEVHSFPEPWSEVLFREEMANPRSHCFILRSTASPLCSVRGYLCFRNVEDESELLKLAVRPEHRRKGFGRVLMDFYVAFCREGNVHKLYLEVQSRNQEALCLYEAFSYRRVGIRPHYYPHRQDALLMLKEV